MSSRWRRFEVLLPLQFNDTRDVPSEWLAEAHPGKTYFAPTTSGTGKSFLNLHS
jgi:hypothetical protein